MLVHCASLAPQLAANSWNKPTQRKKKEEDEKITPKEEKKRNNR